MENDPAMIPYISHNVAPTKLTDLSFNISFIKKEPIITDVATQPTISVKYILGKNKKEDNAKKDRNYSNPDNNDDWDNTDNDW